MSCHHNEAVKENIMMGILGMSEADMIEELGGTDYVKTFDLNDYDSLVDALTEKRFDESPQVE
jgi:hypothetical protein